MDLVPKRDLDDESLSTNDFSVASTVRPLAHKV